MKRFFLFAAIAASTGCVTPKPLPEGRVKVEAAYLGYYKEEGLYVLRFYAKRYDTLKIQQRIKPKFHFREVVYLEWNCSDSTTLHDVKILKNK